MLLMWENLTENNSKIKEISQCVKFLACLQNLKALGHAILDNFSTDQMVIELTKISQKQLKTIEDLKQNTGKPRRDMDKTGED